MILIVKFVYWSNCNLLMNAHYEYRLCENPI